MALRVVTAAREPELVARAGAIDGGFYEYNQHGEVTTRLWPRLIEEFPACQLAMLDEQGEIVAVGNTIPCRWDGTVQNLPGGIDDVLVGGFDPRGSDFNALSALLIKVSPSRAGQGLSPLVVGAMRDLAVELGVHDLIAPVRPSWKVRYPIAPIEEYAYWIRPDGLPFDPWMRVHSRLGASILGPASESIRIAGTVADWETWTGMQFPASGWHVFPGGLAPVHMDVDADHGVYFEPNVWMRHRLTATAAGR
jgi:hypothetical protein